MLIKPYSRPPTRKPRIIYVSNAGEYVDESGSVVSAWDLPPHSICFTAWGTARALTRDEKGQSLMWRNRYSGSYEEVKWRPEKHPEEDKWVPRAFDANVIRGIPFTDDTESCIDALTEWRDWLWQYRVVPGTLGATSQKLLRATLTKELWTSRGWERDRILQSSGGRQDMGPAAQGEYRGRIFHWDMSAAYAREIGGLLYGKRWIRIPAPTRRRIEQIASNGIPVFVRAVANIPEGLERGPLVKRSESKAERFVNVLLLWRAPNYPTGIMEGIWSWEEVAVAEKAGCDIRVLEMWYHTANPVSPFEKWWGIIQEGRSLRDMAALLAKTTGNALWGRFAFVPSAGYRQMRFRHHGNWIKKRIPPIPGSDKMIPALDLAEIVAGRVRARLYEAELECGTNLICAHTDGLWAVDTNIGHLFPTWRVKHEARVVRALSPQHLQYWKRSDFPSTIYSGVPTEEAETVFNREWEVFIAEKHRASEEEGAPCQELQ